MEGIMERISYAAAILEASRDLPENIREPAKIAALVGFYEYGGLHAHSAGDVVRDLAERIEDGLVSELTLKLALGSDGYHLTLQVLDAKEGEAVKSIREAMRDGS